MDSKPDPLLPAEVEYYKNLWSIICACKRPFNSPNGYGRHIQTCQAYLKSVQREKAEKRSSFQEKQTARKVRGKSRLTSWFGAGGDLDFDTRAPEQSLQPDIEGQPRSGIEERSQAEPAEPIEVIEEANIPEAPVELGRGHRKKKLTTRFKDYIPHGHAPLGTTVPSQNAGPSALSEASTSSPQPPLPIKNTPKNSFGLYKRYQSKEDMPHDPDAFASPVDLEEEPAANVVMQLQEGPSPDFYPYPNINSFKLGSWFWSDRNQKSKESWKELTSIVGDPSFRSEDIKETDWEKIDRVLGSSEFEEKESSNSPWYDDGTSWNTSQVTIKVPFNSRTAAVRPHQYTLEGFRHRPILPIIKDKVRSSGGEGMFHHVPHELRWKPGEGKEDVRVYNELYQSDAFLQAYEEVQKLPGPEGCNLPRCVVGLMFASDATMLATFGNAKLWPLYMFFANDSKFQRGKPSLKLGEHIAYFEKLPDDFKDWYLKHSGKDTTLSQATLTHCQRELFHEQWKVLLDDDFLDAYEHGFVVECADGVKRRFYPRILTYSADYPEKILIASIKNLGKYPCPTCAVAMEDVPNLGTTEDRDIRTQLVRVDDTDRQTRIKKARDFIYGPKRLNVNSKAVNTELDHLSLVPTENAFSQRLSHLVFNLYSMLASDVLHEVELGIWKSLFIHLIRLLEALNRKGVNDLNYRYRRVPTFGKDTIRRFRNNTSEMKQLAARDYEDMLQCAIPVFDGLFPDEAHSKTILELLFTMAHWHSLAKSRMLTDHTLTILDTLTTDLGAQFREFVATICQEVETKELAREFQARQRRDAKKQQKTAIAKGNKRQKIAHVPDTSPDEPDTDGKTAGRQPKTFNLQTYKFHALGHIVANIKRFSTCDNTSTQLPESYHRTPRAHYLRTNKKDVQLIFARIQMRQVRLKRLHKQLMPSKSEGKAPSPSKAHYFIGKSQNKPVDILYFVRTHREDPVTWNFYRKLKLHLLPRVRRTLRDEAHSNPDNYGHILPTLESLIELEDQELPLDAEAQSERVFIHAERAYAHQILQINYSTYDTRREQDILNPNTGRRDIMCLRREYDPAGRGSASHQFCYARILGIYHVNVIFLGKGYLDRCPRRFDVLWVRWY